MEKNCPLCGARMEFRLGVFECPACGHEAQEAAPVKEEPEPGSAGPGFKRPWTPPGGATSPVAAPPPGTLVHGERYGDETLPRKDRNSRLDLEKKIYIGIQAGTSILSSIFWIITSFSMEGVSPVQIIMGQVIGVPLGILLLAWILYSSPKWVKMCCIGCNGFSLLVVLIGMLGVLGNLEELTYGYFISMQELAAFAWVFRIMIIIQMAYGIWYISILYRAAAED